MKITDLFIKDFLSVGEVSLVFPNAGFLLVDGWNQDSQSANGAGKSSILSAISWCLFGKTPREISSSAITRSGCKSCTVVVKFILNRQSYTLTRSRPNALEISINDSDKRSIEQNELQDIIGITYEKYLTISYFAQGLGNRFLDLSDTDRKTLFLDLSKSSDFLKGKSAIDERIKLLQKEESSIQQNINISSSKIEELLEYDFNLKELNESKSIEEKKVNNFKKHLLNIDIPAPDISQFQEMKSKLKKELVKISESKGELRSLHSQFKRAQIPNRPFAPLSCPHCKVDLIVEDDSITICQTQSIREAEQRQIEKNKKVLEELNQKIKTLDSFILKEDRLLDAIQKCDTRIEEISYDYLRSQDDIKSTKSTIALCQQKIDSLNRDIEKSEKIKTRLTNLQNSLSLLKTDLLLKNNELQIAEAVGHTLGPSGIQSYLLDAIIDQFNENIRQVLSIAWPIFNYELLTFKENKNGSFSTRFSENIQISGVTRSLGALSGGEIRCLSVVIDIALIKTFEMYSGFIPSPIILDEPFIHLDSYNREKAIEILQSIANDSLVIVVDHENECKSLFDKIIQVDKINGITSAIIQ